MTVIDGIEIDHIRLYERNVIKEAVRNNSPIEDNLHVIMVVSNPCQYKKRYILARNFIERMLDEENVILYIVELCHNNQEFVVTDKKNRRHLQIRTETAPLWHKENMVNMGVKHLLPKNWKAVAWVDADIEFESNTWALDTLKILNGCKDIVQIFSQAIDLNHDNTPMNIFTSAGYQLCKGYKYCGRGIGYWHPGFAWACTRKAYEKMGGLYDLGILGSGDNIMMLSLIKNGQKALSDQNHENYLQSVADFQDRVKNLRFGYVPTTIRHYFHGVKKNRKYAERWQILINHDYNPDTFVTRRDDGLLVPTSLCPQGLLEDIMKYFRERNEDDFAAFCRYPVLRK